MLLLAALALQSGLPVPPPMPIRPISEERPGPAGTKFAIEDGPVRATLFVPEGTTPSREVRLTVHFHTAEWHVIQEHTRRGLAGPLLVFNLGQGSSTYAKPFQDVSLFPRVCQTVLERLRAEGWPKESRVASVDISSFSAGYGAVRELVKQPFAFGLMRRVVLGDSLYGSFGAGRTPLDAHVEVWRPLAEAAIRGKRTFLITVSEVPTEGYASSSEMARALLAKVGVREERVLPGPQDSAHPLLTRADRGRFHVWFYGGNDAMAHMTHARHLADVWKALDEAGAP